MKLIFLSILLSFSPIEKTELNTVRVEFFDAAIDEGKRERFLETMEALGDNSPLSLAYLGAAKSMMAAVVYNPYTKLKYFEDGKDLIEKAVKQSPNSPEIRFVRYLVQSNTPDFLDYSSNLAADTRIIKHAISQSETKALWMQQFEAYQAK